MSVGGFLAANYGILMVFRVLLYYVGSIISVRVVYYFATEKEGHSCLHGGCCFVLDNS